MRRAAEDGGERGKLGGMGCGVAGHKHSGACGGIWRGGLLLKGSFDTMELIGDLQFSPSCRALTSTPLTDTI